MTKVRALVFGSIVVLGVPIGACGEEEGDHHGNGGAVGPSTEALCPTPQMLTYDNFGRDFMSKYCLSCHSSAVKGADRRGAPDDHDFDDIDQIRGLKEHIDQKAGSGPAATNTGMPRSEPRPTVDERKKLSEWLACNAP